MATGSEPSAVTVVIPAYNAGRTIAETLHAVLAQSQPPAAVVVVDDGSKDDTAAVAAAVDGVQVITRSNTGPAAARNVGLRAATTPYVAFTDSDCRPTPTWLAELTAGFDGPTVAGVGGHVRGVGDDLISRYVDSTHMLDPGVLEDGTVESLITANACFRREALLSIGGFGEQFRKPGGEEPEVCERLRVAGYVLRAVPGGVVYHHHKQSVRVLMRTMSNYGEGRWLLSAAVPRYAWPDRPWWLFARHLFNARRVVAGVRRRRAAVGLRTAVAHAGLKYLSEVAFYWGYRRAAAAGGGRR